MSSRLVLRPSLSRESEWPNVQVVGESPDVIKQ
jgi:hypothetical protein